MALAVDTFGSSRFSGVASSSKKTLRLAVGALVTGAAMVATVWMVATVLTMQTVVGSLSTDRSSRLDASLGLNAMIRTAPRERVVRLAKFSRLAPQPLLALNVKAKAEPHRTVAANASAMPVTAILKARAPVLVAAAGSMETLTTGSIAPAGLPSAMASALVDGRPTTDDGTPTKPFNLVLSDAQTAHVLPDMGPLPLSRPPELSNAALGSPAARTSTKPVKELAYARPNAPMADDDDDAPLRPSFSGRKGVAYYDISAGVVYMPSGEKLEAHSGIGNMRDNPDFVHVTMKGPTPPGTYKVTMREALFHGVEAVRLTPTDGVAPHGRVGLLAHSYLLRKRGDSHGCVAFAEYPKFLKAFKRGEITHMVIVKSMKGGFSPARKTLASLFSRKG